MSPHLQGTRRGRGWRVARVAWGGLWGPMSPSPRVPHSPPAPRGDMGTPCPPALRGRCGTQPWGSLQPPRVQSPLLPTPCHPPPAMSPATHGCCPCRWFPVPGGTRRESPAVTQTCPSPHGNRDGMVALPGDSAPGWSCSPPVRSGGPSIPLFAGRVFNGSAKPIDSGPPVMAEDFLDINGDKPGTAAGGLGTPRGLVTTPCPDGQSSPAVPPPPQLPGGSVCPHRVPWGVAGAGWGVPGDPLPRQGCWGGLPWSLPPAAHFWYHWGESCALGCPPPGALFTPQASPSTPTAASTPRR